MNMSIEIEKNVFLENDNGVVFLKDFITKEKTVFSKYCFDSSIDSLVLYVDKLPMYNCDKKYEYIIENSLEKFEL